MSWHSWIIPGHDWPFTITNLHDRMVLPDPDIRVAEGRLSHDLGTRETTLDNVISSYFPHILQKLIRRSSLKAVTAQDAAPLSSFETQLIARRNEILTKRGLGRLVDNTSYSEPAFDIGREVLPELSLGPRLEHRLNKFLSSCGNYPGYDLAPDRTAELMGRVAFTVAVAEPMKALIKALPSGDCRMRLFERGRLRSALERAQGAVSNATAKFDGSANYPYRSETDQGSRNTHFANGFRRQGEETLRVLDAVSYKVPSSFTRQSKSTGFAAAVKSLRLLLAGLGLSGAVSEERSIKSRNDAMYALKGADVKLVALRVVGNATVEAATELCEGPEFSHLHALDSRLRSPLRGEALTGVRLAVAIEVHRESHGLSPDAFLGSIDAGARDLRRQMSPLSQTL